MAGNYQYTNGLVRTGSARADDFFCKINLERVLEDGCVEEDPPYVNTGLDEPDVQLNVPQDYDIICRFPVRRDSPYYEMATAAGFSLDEIRLGTSYIIRMCGRQRQLQHLRLPTLTQSTLSTDTLMLLSTDQNADDTFLTCVRLASKMLKDTKSLTIPSDINGTDSNVVPHSSSDEINSSPGSGSGSDSDSGSQFSSEFDCLEALSWRLGPFIDTQHICHIR